MGHTAASCKGRPRCLLCSQSHSKEVCPNKNLQFKCANCKGPHKANSTDCPIYSMAKDIENVRANQNKSYKQARIEVMTSQRSEKNEHTTYSSALKIPKNNAPKLPQQPLVQIAHMGTQTECEDISTQTNLDNEINLPKNNEKDFIEKLESCLKEILKQCVPEGISGDRDDIIANAIKKSFNCDRVSELKDDKTDKTNKRVRHDSHSSTDSRKNVKVPNYNKNESEKKQPNPKVYIKDKDNSSYRSSKSASHHKKTTHSS